ncbi:hypothetical protein LTR40_010403, partial [Exophiala xenobiotica]
MIPPSTMNQQTILRKVRKPRAAVMENSTTDDNEAKRDMTVLGMTILELQAEP